MKNFLNIKTYLTLVSINQICFDSTNDKVIEKMKDKFKRISVTKFTGLKSNMYCIVTENGE